jgi:hypothetical protein
MLEACATTRAGLGRVGWIDLDHLATSAFSLELEVRDEVGPAGIQDAQSEASAGHRGHAEIFEHNPIESLDQLVDELVEEVSPQVGHADHEALEDSHDFATIRSAQLLAGDRPLKNPELPHDPSVPSRIFGLLTVGERRQAEQTQIDTKILTSLRQWLGRLDLTGQRHEPLAGATVDTSRLDLAFDRAMPTDSNPTDAGELEPTTIDLEPVAILLEAKPSESMERLEPRVAWLLTSFDAPEERLKCLVQISHDVLENMAVNIQCVGVGVLLDLDLAELLDLGDGLTPLLVGFLPVPQPVVVEMAAGIADRLQAPLLALAGIQAVDEGLEHFEPSMSIVEPNAKFNGLKPKNGETRLTMGLKSHGLRRVEFGHHTRGVGYAEWASLYLL